MQGIHWYSLGFHRARARVHISHLADMDTCAHHGARAGVHICPLAGMDTFPQKSITGITALKGVTGRLWASQSTQNMARRKDRARAAPGGPQRTGIHGIRGRLITGFPRWDAWDPNIHTRARPMGRAPEEFQ